MPITPQLDADLNDPVAQHMRTDFARLNFRHTVGEALVALREKPPEGRILYLYVVDDEGRLCGVMPTRRLLLNQPERALADIMIRDVIAIPKTATVLEACEFFTLHRLLAFPVVDDDRRIIGVVDVELYTEELSDIERREGNNDLFQLIGVHLTESQQTSPLSAARRRFPWLLANIGGGLLAAGLSSVYQGELSWNGAVLALFVPVVLALAESVSIQSVSLALQALHARRPTWGLLVRRSGRELLTGGLLGAACAVAVASVGLIWLRQWRVAACLFGGILGSVAAAAVIGLTMPYILRLSRRDPQVAAGPIALASTDMVTLLIYFSLARWLIA